MILNLSFICTFCEDTFRIRRLIHAVRTYPLNSAQIFHQIQHFIGWIFQTSKFETKQHSEDSKTLEFWPASFVMLVELWELKIGEVRLRLVAWPFNWPDESSAHCVVDDRELFIWWSEQVQVKASTLPFDNFAISIDNSFRLLILYFPLILRYFPHGYSVHSPGRTTNYYHPRPRFRVGRLSVILGESDNLGIWK